MTREMEPKTPQSKLDWLVEVDQKARDLIADPEFEGRFSRFLREDQVGKWRLDGISGYYWYLHALVLVTRPKKVVELGRCLGTSALFLLGALDDDATLITVDTEERASELTHQLGDPRLTVLTGNDLDPATFEGTDISGIDFLFVDTDHTVAQATKEWEFYLPFLSENALVVFDDITMNDMGRFWEDLTCAKLETGQRYHYTGFGIVAPSV